MAGPARIKYYVWRRSDGKVEFSTFNPVPWDRYTYEILLVCYDRDEAGRAVQAYRDMGS